MSQIAFGNYSRPITRSIPASTSRPVGTLTGTPAVQGPDNAIYFNLFLPSGPRPEAGWPVAIFGHGVGFNKDDDLAAGVAATMAENGIATIAINAVGFGFGPLSTLTVNPNTPNAVTLPAGGRGIDQNNDGIHRPLGGPEPASPRTIIVDRDGQPATVADLMQLVRVIEVGMDVDGDGSPDLDPSRISYFGRSLGGIYGAAFLAVEPDVLTGVPVVPGGSSVDFVRLGS